jgi:hypothetical protein
MERIVKSHAAVVASMALMAGNGVIDSLLSFLLELQCYWVRLTQCNKGYGQEIYFDAN